MPTRSESTATSIRLTPHAMELWQQVSQKHGMNRTATMEMIIRKEAATLGIKTESQPVSTNYDKK